MELLRRRTRRMLQKFSRRGWICKTVRRRELAQYVVGGVAPQIWNFSVRDRVVAEQLHKAVGQQVRNPLPGASRVAHRRASAIPIISRTDSRSSMRPNRSGRPRGSASNPRLRPHLRRRHRLLRHCRPPSPDGQLPGRWLTAARDTAGAEPDSRSSKSRQMIRPPTSVRANLAGIGPP